MGSQGLSGVIEGFRESSARSWVLRWAGKPWMPSFVTALLAAVVMGRGLGSLPLSFDEFFSLSAVVSDPRNILVHEAPLFPFYAVLWLWTLGGEWTSDVWLRALSLVSAIGATAITTQIARRFGGILVAYVAGLLFVLNPGIQFAARDARPYALGLLMFVAAALALLRALDRQRLGSWVNYSLLLFLATLVMPNGLVYFIVLVLLYDFLHKNFFVSRAFVLSLIPTALLVVFGVLLYSSAISSMRASLPSPRVDWFPTGVIWSGIAEAESYNAPGTMAAILLVLACLTSPGRRAMWGSLATILLVFLVSLGPSSQWMGRTFITLIPLLSLAAALGVVKLDRRALTGVLVVTLLLAVPGYRAIRLPHDSPADLRLATQIIEQESEATDQIFGDGYLGEGRAYELAAGLRHYGSKEPLWEVTTEPTRAFWLLYPDYPCAELFSQDVRGGMSLRRCAAPS